MSTTQIHRSSQRLACRRHQLVCPTATALAQPIAQRRGLDCTVSAARLIEPMMQEPTLLDQVQQFCLDECMHYFRQARVRSCQELPPEAISQMHVPERCWLVRLSISQEEGAEATYEVEGVVSLWDGALHLLLR